MNPQHRGTYNAKRDRILADRTPFGKHRVPWSKVNGNYFGKEHPSTPIGIRIPWYARFIKPRYRRTNA